MNKNRIFSVKDGRFSSDILFKKLNGDSFRFYSEKFKKSYGPIIKSKSLANSEQWTKANLSVHPDFFFEVLHLAGKDEHLKKLKLEEVEGETEFTKMAGDIMFNVLKNMMSQEDFENLILSHRGLIEKYWDYAKDFIYINIKNFFDNQRNFKRTINIFGFDVNALQVTNLLIDQGYEDVDLKGFVSLIRLRFSKNAKISKFSIPSTVTDLDLPENKEEFLIIQKNPNLYPSKGITDFNIITVSDKIKNLKIGKRKYLFLNSESFELSSLITDSKPEIFLKNSVIKVDFLDIKWDMTPIELNIEAKTLKLRLSDVKTSPRYIFNGYEEETLDYKFPEPKIIENLIIHSEENLFFELKLKEGFENLKYLEFDIFPVRLTVKAHCDVIKFKSRYSFEQITRILKIYSADKLIFETGPPIESTVNNLEDSENINVLEIEGKILFDKTKKE